MKKIVVLAVLGFYLHLTGAFAFEKEELDGKWEGTSPLGYPLELTLKVNGNEITGEGRTPPRGKHAGATPTVEGKVDGNNVVIITHSGRSQSKLTYHCSWDEPKLLDCHVKAKNFDTQFKKSD